jgi:hypothetical protein
MRSDAVLYIGFATCFKRHAQCSVRLIGNWYRPCGVALNALSAVLLMRIYRGTDIVLEQVRRGLGRVFSDLGLVRRLRRNN